EINIFAPSSRASATRNSNLRVLLPPNASPVWSSRLINNRAPPKASERQGSVSTRVGRCAKRNRGTSINSDPSPYVGKIQPLTSTMRNTALPKTEDLEGQPVNWQFKNANETNYCDHSQNHHRYDRVIDSKCAYLKRGFLRLRGGGIGQRPPSLRGPGKPDANRSDNSHNPRDRDVNIPPQFIRARMVHIHISKAFDSICR